MSLLKISDWLLKGMANAIRYKHNDTSSLYFPSEYPNYIKNIYDDRMEYMYGMLNNKQYVGNKVIDLRFAFDSKSSVSGNAIVPDSVIWMDYAYNATGVNVAVCGAGVTSMMFGYANTKVEHGECGSAVQNFRSAYNGCKSLVNCNYSDSILDMSGAFYNCTNFIGPAFSGPLTTNMYQSYSNCNSLMGTGECGPRVKNFAYAYYKCSELTGPVTIAEKVDNAAYAYYLCNNIITQPSCGSRVENLSYAYYGCEKITGSAVIGTYTENADHAYYNCKSLTHIAPEAPSLHNASYLYANCVSLAGDIPYYPALSGSIENMCYNCSKITGTVKMFDGVTSMRYAFYNARSLSGVEINSNTIQNAEWSFYGCQSLTYLNCHFNNIVNMVSMFENCNKLGGDMYINTIPYEKYDNGEFKPVKYDFKLMFARRNSIERNRINLYVKDPALYENIYKATSATASLTGFLTRYNNGVFEGIPYFYNSTYKMYVYNIAGIDE